MGAIADAETGGFEPGGANPAVRDAAEADAAEIAAIWNRFIRETAATFNSVEKPADEVAALIGQRQREGKAFLVAEAQGRVIGFATFFQLRAGAGYARTFEHTVQVAPEAAGQGAGRALMAHLERRARDAGGHSLHACVSAENPGGVAFHERIGFERIAVLPEVGRKFDRWMDLIVMRKAL